MTTREQAIEDLSMFGIKEPQAYLVAIMTDTDNTDESATAFYGDILLKK